MKRFLMMCATATLMTLAAGCAPEPGFGDDAVVQGSLWQGPKAMLQMEYPIPGFLPLSNYQGSNLVVITLSESSTPNVQAFESNVQTLRDELKGMGYNANVVIQLLDDSAYQGKFESGTLPVTQKNTELLGELSGMFDVRMFERGHTFVFDLDGNPMHAFKSSVLENASSVADFAKSLEPYLDSSVDVDGGPTEPGSDPVTPPTPPVDNGDGGGADNGDDGNGDGGGNDTPPQNITWQGPNGTLTMTYPTPGQTKQLSDFVGKPSVFINVSVTCGICRRAAEMSAQNLEAEMASRGHDVNVAVMMLSGYNSTYDYLTYDSFAKNDQVIFAMMRAAGTNSLSLGQTYVLKNDGSFAGMTNIKSHSSAASLADEMAGFLGAPTSGGGNGGGTTTGGGTNGGGSNGGGTNGGGTNNGGPWTGPTGAMQRVYPSAGSEDFGSLANGKYLIAINASETCGICVNAMNRTAVDLENQLAAQGVDAKVVIMLLNSSYSGRYDSFGFSTYAKNDRLIFDLMRAAGTNSLSLGQTYVLSPTGQVVGLTNVKSHANNAALVSFIKSKAI